jgi:uncharacterized protein YjbI with pentapeptide repeats
MADRGAVRAARLGTDALQEWQVDHGPLLDLSWADLHECDLRWMNFAGANLRGASFEGALLTGAYFGPAEFSAKPPHVTPRDTPIDLENTSFVGATLLATTFNYPMIRGANFERAYLGLANFRNVTFTENSFEAAELLNTTFAACSMNGICGLDRAIHLGPSHLDVFTLQQSPALTHAFLRQTGIPDTIVDYLPSLIESSQAIRFHSCFLSHSSDDKAFCDLLYATLVRAGVRVWYAPEDVRGGERLVPQLTKAINLHDKVIIVLSASSIGSQWVANEIKWARRRQESSGRQALFPLSLVSFDVLRDWELIDADTGVDLAAEVRSYFVPDFSRWQVNSSFEQSVERLLRDLRANEVR